METMLTNLPSRIIYCKEGRGLGMNLSSHGSFPIVCLDNVNIDQYHIMCASRSGQNLIQPIHACTSTYIGLHKGFYSGGRESFSRILEKSQIEKFH